MKFKKLLVFLLAASIMLENVLPVYAGNAASIVIPETVETVSPVKATVSVNAQEEISGFEGMTETTVSEESSESKILQEDAVSQNNLTAEPDYILGREMTAEEIAQQQSLVPELVPMESIQLDTDNLYAGMNVNLFSELEADYDSRDLNIITGVRNQNPWGTCWAFATFAALESSLVKQGLESKDGIDLSERHLVYFASNTGYDALGNASLDTITQPNESYYLKSGGNLTRAATRLMNWQGAALEATYPYSNSSEVIAKENAQDIVATAKDIYFIPTKDKSTEEETNVIKNLIKTYGCVAWSYFDDDTCYNNSTGAYYRSEYDSYNPTNHAITVVGWDDNYSKDNFLEGKQPTNNGAWIIKNSWGTSWGKEGYFYISYEDATLGQGNDAGVIIAGEADEYDNNYFYSNCCYLYYYPGRTKIAQVFEAKSGAGQEILSAVSFMLASANETYEIQVYKNPATVDGVVTNPESGEAMYSAPFAGETGYAGVYTIDIPKVVLQKGDTFAVVVTFTDSDGASVFYDGSMDGGTASRSMTNATEAGQSFWSYGYGWSDLNTEQYSVRMNVFTRDASGTVPVLSYKKTNPVSFTDTQKNRITWTECADATYEIYRSESADGIYTKIGSVESGTNVYTDTLITEQWSTTYYYKVKAVFSDTAAESEILEIPGGMTLKMSEITVTSETESNVISWTQVAGADGYEIQRKLETESTFTDLVTLEGGAILTYTDQLNGETDTYEYRIRAYKDSTYTLWSDSVMADNVEAELFTYNYNGTPVQRIRVKWEALEEASSYKMQATRNINGGARSVTWSTSGLTVTINTDNLAYKDSSGVADSGIGEEYTFSVIPLDASNIKITPNPYRSVKKIWTPMEVLSVSHEYSGGNAVFTWTGASNAEFIEVYRSTDAESHEETVFKTIDAVNEASFTDSGLEKGDIYYYWLYSGVTNNAGEKVYSESYCYKLEVLSDAESITLELSSETGKIGEQISVSINEIVSGEKCLYDGEVVWSAQNGTKSYTVITEGLLTRIMGSDNKEILRINDRTLEIIGESVDKEVTLTATVGSFTDEAKITVKVPVTEVTIGVVRVNDEERDTLPELLYLYDCLGLEVRYSPQNADVDEIRWDYDDSMVNLGKGDNGITVVDIKKAGDTLLKANVTSGENTLSAQMDLSSGLKNVTINEVKALDAKRLQILWDCVYDEELYHIYRKAEGDTEYRLLQENISRTSYIDNTVETEVNYEYKILLVKDGITSSLDSTEAKGGRTEKGKLILSGDEIKLSKGESYKVSYTVSTGEEENEILTWTACDAGKAALSSVKENESIIFNGEDGKEICRIAENEIIATGLSATKEVYLTAENSSGCEGSCKVVISVPVSGFSLKDITINGEKASDINVLNSKDKVAFSVVREPENADECTLTWKSSDSSIVQLSTFDDGKTIELDALTKGICKITAVTSNGLEKSWQIQILNEDEVLEYWIVNSDEELVLSDVISGIDEEYTYILNENYKIRGCELAADSTDVNEKARQLKVYGLKKYTNTEIGNPSNAEDFYKLEEISDQELVFVSTNPAVAAVSEEGKITAAGAGETEVFAYGKTAKEKYGKYHVTVIGNAIREEEKCPIDKNAKLSAVAGKVYLEQFSHHSNSSAVLEIKDKQGKIYSADCFTFVSADSSVCIVDENGVVRVNPAYTGSKDKNVKVTANVKNDSAKRKVTFTVVIYGKQQISGLEISYNNEMPEYIAMQHKKKGTVTVAVKAYGSNGEEIQNPTVKWTVSNSAVASVKQNKDGTATVTMKKPGQCSIICTATDSFKTSDSLLLKAVDITPVLDKKTVKLETKKAERKSESFTLTSVYGTRYAEPEIRSAKIGKTDYTGEVEVVKNANYSYSLRVSESMLTQMKNNSKVVIVMSVEVDELQEAVNITEAEFTMILQFVTKEPSVTVKEAGTINRYSNSGKNVRSLLTIKTTENVTNIEAGKRNNFNNYFDIIKENGQWYLELKDAKSCNSNSMEGNLLITLEGYQTIEKTITVKTPNKTPEITQSAIPVINVNSSSEKTAEVTILNNKKLMDNFEVEAVNETAAKADVVKSSKGKVQVALKNDASFQNNETVPVTIRVWETDEYGNRIWQEPVQFTLKVQVSVQEPKLDLKQKNVILNKQAELEETVVVLSSNQDNVTFMDTAQWTIKSYNNATKKYDMDVDWLQVSYEKASQELALKLKSGRDSMSEPALASYKIRISGIIEGFEDAAVDFKVKVIDTRPTVSVKTSGKLDLTHKASCSLTGKLTFKNTISNEIAVAEVVGDSRFYAEVTGKNSIALSVTDEGMPESSILATSQQLKLRVTMAGGTVINTIMQIKPVCTIPKMILPAMKTLYKSVRNQEVKYNFGEKLAEGAKINKLEVISSPNQFNVIAEDDVLRVSINEKDKGMKAGTYSIKVKVIFEGASAKPQNKTIKVKVVE